MCMENEIKISNEKNINESIIIEKPKGKKFKTESGIFVFLFIFSFAFLTSLYFLNIFITPIKVVGASMQPTINTQIINDEDEQHCDIVYFKKSDNYNHGDIIIMSNPNKKYVDRHDVNFMIKRIIACEGDTIKFIPKSTTPAILINSPIYYSVEVYNENQELILSEENYIKEEMYYKNNEENYYYSLSFNTFGQIFTALKNGRITEITIPKDQYFVMGDNRNNSTDSRVFGCVDFEDINGSVRLQIEYGETLLQTIFEKMKLLLERCL